MWKIYGQSNQSVCISTTVGKVLDSLILPDNMKISAARVEYIDHSEQYYNNSHRLDPFIHKHLAYQYEREARIIVYPESQNPLLERHSNIYGTRIRLTGPNFIEEIKVSPEAPDWFYELIKNIKDKYNLQAEVCRSYLDQLANNYGN